MVQLETEENNRLRERVRLLVEERDRDQGSREVNRERELFNRHNEFNFQNYGYGEDDICPPLNRNFDMCLI